MDARRGLMLGGALALLLYATWLPHGILPGGDWNPFPIHMDEYVHWGYARAAADQGTAQFRDPFSGAPAGGTVLKERGFHAFFAAFEVVSGADWRLVVTVAPLATAALLGCAAFVLAERWRAGIPAVVLLAAVPTTLRFLGIGFFVPIAFALPLTLLAFDALGRTSEGGLGPFAILVAGAWTIHPMAGATIMVFTLSLSVLLNRHADRGLVLAVLVAFAAFAAAWPIYSSYLTAGLPLAPLPASLEEFRAALPLLVLGGFGALGAAFVKNARERALLFALASTAVFLDLVIVYRNASGRDAFFLYDRSFLLTHAIAAVLGGVAIGVAWRVGVGWFAREWRAAGAVVLALALVVPAVIVGVSWHRQDASPRYLMLNDDRLASYEAAARVLDRRAPRALVDGLPTMAWTDVTGVPTVFVWTPSGTGPPREVVTFFGQHANDTQFLLANAATLVVTEQPVSNPDLEPLAPGVYQLRPALLAQVVTGHEKA